MAESMYFRSSNRAHTCSSLVSRLLVVPALLWSCLAYADEPAQHAPPPRLSQLLQSPKLSELPKLPHNLQIHGFASQGWFMSSGNNNVFGKSSSDSGSFDFRELGLNASMRPLTNLQFSAQMMSRTAGEGSPGNIRLDYGFIDYTYF